MELSNYGLPRKVKERMILEYLNGLKTIRMLSDDSGMSYNAITKMIFRYKNKYLPTFEGKSLLTSGMAKKTKTVKNDDSAVEIENLRRQLKEARLKIEGYQIMGEILEEEYGIDLLKKSGAKQSPDSKNDTQK